MSVSLFRLLARPGRLITEVEVRIYFKLLLTYRTDRTTQAMRLIRRVNGGPGSNLEAFTYNAIALPTELRGISLVFQKIYVY